MKRILLSLLLLIITVAVHSQNFQRTWRLGKLTWNDFVMVCDSNLADHSYLEFVLDIDFKDAKSDKLIVPIPMAVAYVEREKSWVEESHLTPLELRYNQVMFDLAEIYRRRLQQHIDTLDYEEDMIEDCQKAMKALVSQVENFITESNHGGDSLVVAHWEQYTAHALTTLPDTANPAFKYEIGNVTFGWSIGGGFFGVGGELKDYFTNGGGACFGVEYGIKRHEFFLDMDFGFCRCKKTAANTRDDRNTLHRDEHLTAVSMFAAYGYSVLNKKNIRITPFVGYGFVGYYYTEDDGDVQQSTGPADGCLYYGLDFLTYQTTNLSYGEASTLALNARFFAANNQFNSIEDTPKGFTYGLQLGVAFHFGTFQKVRRKE